MSSFTDLKGKAWEIVLTLGAARRIDNSDASLIYDKPICFLDSKKASDSFFEDIILNDGLALFLVWCIVKPQAESNDPSIDENEFAERLGPEQIQVAKEALWEQISRFFPEREILFSRLKSFYREAYQKAGEQLEKQKEPLFREYEREVEREINQRLKIIRQPAGET